MKRKNIAFLTLVFAWLGSPTGSYATTYYVFSRALHTQTLEQLRTHAENTFRTGIPSIRTLRYENTALDFYNWLTDSQANPYYSTVFTSIEGFNRRLPPGTSGILFNVSPDERVFDTRLSIINLAGVVGNQGDERRQILRFLNEAGIDFSHLSGPILTAGFPLSTDTSPVDTIIQGRNIISGMIYMNGAWTGEIVMRNEQRDGPFAEGAGTHVAEGYPFDRVSGPPPVFPAQGDIVSVARGTDNLTVLAVCSRPSSSARTTLLAGFNRTHSGCEKISLEEFKRRHLRHQSISGWLLLTLE